MSEAPEVTLIRHADADYRALAARDPVYLGARRDLAPLTEAGRRQARRLAGALESVGPRLVLSSPYTRTLETAAIIAGELGCDLVVDLRLHDWLPVRDGSRPVSASLVQEKIAEYERWLSTGALPARRTWETDDEIRVRLAAAVGEHRDHLPLAVVTHEAPIRAIIGAVPVAPASRHAVSASRLAGGSVGGLSPDGRR